MTSPPRSARSIEPGTPAKYIDFPKARYGVYQVDRVLADGADVGISHDAGYITGEQVFVSLASVDAEHAEPGTEVVVVWGEDPVSRKPAVEPHRQVRDPRDGLPGAVLRVRPRELPQELTHPSTVRTLDADAARELVAMAPPRPATRHRQAQAAARRRARSAGSCAATIRSNQASVARVMSAGCPDASRAARASLHLAFAPHRVRVGAGLEPFDQSGSVAAELPRDLVTQPLVGADRTRSVDALDDERREALHEDRPQQPQSRRLARSAADDDDRHTQRAEPIGQHLPTVAAREQLGAVPRARHRSEHRHIRHRDAAATRELRDLAA